MTSRRHIGRREFLGRSAALGVGTWAAAPAARVLGANDRLRLGLIGAGARGRDLLSQGLKLPNAELVAAADVYTRPRDGGRSVVAGIPRFHDHTGLPDRQG